MRSSTPFWLVVITAVTLLAVWMVLPNNPGLFGRPIEVRPGLDIQGGLRVLLEAEPGVNVTTDSLDRAKTIIENRVNALGVAEPVIQVSGTNRIVVELPGVRDPQQAIDLIKQTGLLEFVDFSKSGSCTASFPVEGQFIYTDAQARLRSGGNKAGTVTPTVTSATATVGGNTATAQATTSGTTVTVTVPAAVTTAAATLVPTTAIPTNTMVPASNTPAPTATPAATTAAAAPATADASTATRSAFNTNIDYARPAFQATAAATTAATVATPAATTAATNAPAAAVTAAATVAATTPGPTPTPTEVVRDGSAKEKALLNPCTNQPFTTAMTGDGLKDAYAAAGGQLASQWVIQFSINDNEEGRKFGPFTGSHVQQQMAIVLDGRVLSAPVIQNRLDNGGQITGNFTQQQAKDLALSLRYGALPIPLNTVSIEQVGASLGAESVEATARAGVLGVLVVLIYMIISYRVPGIVAALALLLFAAINFALYKFIPVTLTLPAITGFLISVGTAVDGNILIFERVREELRYGRSLEKAIEVGFSRAWPSIRDSNISTAIIGIILFVFGGTFGASAVRGFAITLVLGLAVNIFTAVIVTRTLLDVVFRLMGETLKKNNWMIGS